MGSLRFIQAKDSQRLRKSSDDSFVFFFLCAVDTKVEGGRGGAAGARILAAAAAAAALSSPPASHQRPAAEPPRTLLRGILSQQPSGGVGNAVGLVNLHSILQPGHPALRPGCHDQGQSYHPSLAHHPHVKPGKETNWCFKGEVRPTHASLFLF